MLGNDNMTMRKRMMPMTIIVAIMAVTLVRWCCFCCCYVDRQARYYHLRRNVIMCPISFISLLC